MNALTPIAGKLAKLLRMLSSNREPEVLAAAQALCRTLESAGADIHALAAIVEHGGELNQAEMKKHYDAKACASPRTSTTVPTTSATSTACRAGTK